MTQAQNLYTVSGSIAVNVSLLHASGGDSAENFLFQVLSDLQSALSTLANGCVFTTTVNNDLAWGEVNFEGTANDPISDVMLDIPDGVGGVFILPGRLLVPAASRSQAQSNAAAAEAAMSTAIASRNATLVTGFGGTGTPVVLNLEKTLLGRYAFDREDSYGTGGDLDAYA